MIIEYLYRCMYLKIFTKYFDFLKKKGYLKQICSFVPCFPEPPQLPIFLTHRSVLAMMDRDKDPFRYMIHSS